MGFQDCEYVEEGPTKTEQLEEQIAVLEARIEELEKPRELRASGTFQSPVVGGRRAASLPALSRGGSPRLVYSTLSYSEIPSPTTMPTVSGGIPLPELESLVHNFLQHCTLFGFFLHIRNFAEAALGRSGPRPLPALLHAVHLWAIHLSGNEELVANYEAQYLSRTLRSAVGALSTASNNILHAIQAEVLISQYFFRTTRFLEGKYHLSAAVSLVLSSGLHRLRSAEVAAGNRGFLSAAPQTRSPTVDPLDDMERVAAFWTVLTMNNCWTTADGSPSNLAYTSSGSDARIDTPWPVDPVKAIKVSMPPSLIYLQNSGVVELELSFGTVNAFLANVPDTATSIPALHSKSAILFERASRLVDTYRPDLNPSQLAEFYDSFNSLEALIHGFLSKLPEPNSTTTMHTAREVFLIHSLSRVALIQLHNPFVDVAGNSHIARRQALDAARGIVAILTLILPNDFVFVDPITGVSFPTSAPLVQLFTSLSFQTLFMATAQVFIGELDRYRRSQAVGQVWDGDMDEQHLMDAVEIVLATMNIFAPTCRLMNSQLQIMHRAYHSVSSRP
ncbi:Fungal-trans domain-containing protein [Mycena indigotica]|uniref:Fungal-trans domain-containing protein n=1 Tax=Mycena indigotica TaxID=2126181 RepID=A0A8H6SI44_9AGAR|nr:Fungal-trans domain-containing protein [Mycena indigotica]KAF7298767.1 Fungal-trans domain-containing protein [Mycena indigotica]